VALPAAERAPELQATTELTLPPADTTANLPSAGVANAGDASTSNAAQIVPVPTITPQTTALLEPVVTPVTNGMAKLEFSANQETWVNVKDASGREVYSKIIFAGSRESIDVKLPSNVTVGNAGATNLSMNGKSIELAPYSRNNVAHIKLE
jgi:cytoskeleton protein RodZ